MANDFPVFVAKFKLSNTFNNNVKASFMLVVREAEDITDAVWQARDAARTMLNLGPHEEPNLISISRR